MNAKVQIRIDAERGCGWRKPGGLYLISGGVSSPCGLLPIPLATCPTCSCGIKPTRGWTWIDPLALSAGKGCSAAPGYCFGCSLSRLNGKHGLLWIGGSFYERPQDWTDEAIRLGVSRRIAAVPKDFKLGETWVFVAHRDTDRRHCGTCDGTGKQLDSNNIILEGAPACTACKGEGSQPVAAIFHAFLPTAIEYVVKGDETEDQLDKLIARGITPVQVEHDPAQASLPETEEDLTLVED
jgi:hypothetical protein